MHENHVHILSSSLSHKVQDRFGNGRYFESKDVFLFSYVYLCLCVCACECSAQRSQKRASDAQEIKDPGSSKLPNVSAWN